MSAAAPPTNRRDAAPGPGVDLVLLWHMHQPDYRDGASGEFTMPWVYLHALKDYSDMAWHLEQQPRMRCVVNFVPVLIDQIEDYVAQFAGGVLRDPLLRLLARSEARPLEAAERLLVLDRCFRANHSRLIEPYPAYRRLHEIFTQVQARGAPALDYLSDRFFYDLLAWYHLSWTGESVRRSRPLVGQLMEKGMGFGDADRAALLALVGEELAGIVPRYRRLAERGQVELTSTPHCHPLSPLLLDLGCARETLPDAPLPAHPAYPGGRESVCAHLDEALESHARRFGAAPRGIWPAEGALSEPFAAILSSRGVEWTASSEAVLRNSLRRAGGGTEAKEQLLYRPWRLPGIAGKTIFLFRDDRLSDLIGFEYSRWHGADAAAHFARELETLADAAGTGERPLVSVMLDGENAWEYYPYNAFFFFTDFYKALASHKRIRALTGADVVTLHGAPPEPGTHPIAAARDMGALTAGSWVYGNLTTWIGSPDKNKAWDLLCEAKARYDEVMARSTLNEAQRAAATRQLRDCESSDWFWWPGEHNPGPSVAAFESLFRSKLANLYRLIDVPAPPELSEVFTRGGVDAELGGTMRRTT